MKNVCFAVLCLFLLNACASSAPKTAAEPAKDGAAEAAKKAEPAKPATAGEKKAETASAGRVVCKNGKDERIIESVKTDGGGCEVKYTKFGESNTVASARSDMSHCEQVSSRIQSNLANAGYTCG